MSLHKRVVRRVSGLVLDYLLALPIGCAAALLWANTLPDSYYRFAHATAFAVNDVGMVFFFALITKEVVEATLPGGALHPWRRAALPVAAAAGGVAVSIACYLAFVHHAGEPMLTGGWVAACAIDIPGSYIIARMIFGRHPAVPFLLLLAIAADAIGLAFVAVLQPWRRAPRDRPWSHGRRRRLGRGLAVRRRQEFLAVPPRAWPGVLVGPVPGRRASRARVGARSCRFSRTGDTIQACSSRRRRRRTIR